MIQEAIQEIEKAADDFLRNMVTDQVEIKKLARYVR